jgi:hypothetical protein
MDKAVRISLFLIPDYKFSINVLDVSLLVPCSSLSLSLTSRTLVSEIAVCNVLGSNYFAGLVAIAISVELEATLEGRRGGDREDNCRFRRRKRTLRQTRYLISEIYSPKANMIVTNRNRAQQDYRIMQGTHARMEAILGREVDYPPLRYLWKQAPVPDAVFCVPRTLHLRLAYDLLSNRARLPELDQETVEV